MDVVGKADSLQAVSSIYVAPEESIVFIIIQKRNTILFQSFNTKTTFNAILLQCIIHYE